MPDIRAIFWDVGGVLLTNGWDREARRQAAARFGVDWEDFDARHQRVAVSFELGRISLETYLAETVFAVQREFTQEEFGEYMYSRSKPHPETIDIAARLARDGNYFMATINNESLPINLYRIKTFRLREFFHLFLSSCFLGHRKPEREMYELALRLTQQPPGSCVFIDDRDENIAPAGALGMHTIHFESSEQLVRELRRLGVEVPPRESR